MLRFIDFFAGIGGFRLGLEKAGMKCIGFCEKDKFAVKYYTAMYDTKGEWYADDVTKIKPGDIPKADLWCAGSPCQAVSIAGKRSGIYGERSNLFFNFVNLLKGKAEKDEPKWIICENVKGLLSSNKGWDFLEYLCELELCGYSLEWQVVNSKNFGTPQNRERVYTVGHIRSGSGRKILPVTGENGAALSQIIGGLQGNRVYDVNGVSVTLSSNGGGCGAKTGLYLIDQSTIKPKITDTARCITARYNAGFVNRTAANSAVLEVDKINVAGNYSPSNHSASRVVSPVGISPAVMENHSTVTAVAVDETVLKIKNGTKKGYDTAKIGDSINLGFPNNSGKRGRVGHDISHTLTANDKCGAVVENNHSIRIRKLTPKECFRLQGFPDDLFEKARTVNSDSQLYKQAGNAVTVNVVYAIGKKIAEQEE